MEETSDTNTSKSNGVYEDDINEDSYEKRKAMEESTSETENEEQAHQGKNK